MPVSASETLVRGRIAGVPPASPMPGGHPGRVVRDHFSGRAAERRSDAASQPAEARLLGHSDHLLEEEHPLGDGDADTCAQVTSPYSNSTTRPVSSDSMAAAITFWAARPSAPEPSISAGAAPSDTCFTKV